MQKVNTAASVMPVSPHIKREKKAVVAPINSIDRGSRYRKASKKESTDKIFERKNKKKLVNSNWSRFTKPINEPTITTDENMHGYGDKSKNSRLHRRLMYVSPCLLSKVTFIFLTDIDNTI